LENLIDYKFSDLSNVYDFDIDEALSSSWDCFSSPGSPTQSIVSSSPFSPEDCTFRDFLHSGRTQQ
jgi:hypothetical protein